MTSQSLPEVDKVITMLLDELITLIGEAGQRLSDILASEGAAGNISIGAAWPLDLRRRFPNVETIPLPIPVPQLAGKNFLVTGSGRRLREILKDPTANLGGLVVLPGGETGELYTAPGRQFKRLTSEFNTHLAVHQDQMARTGAGFQAILHAQPRHLTFLSHISRYQDELYLNRHLLRWQPELILQLPQGIGVVPFQLPGSNPLMEATTASLRQHHLTVWAKHGVMAISNTSIQHALDLIEYAETAAHYEFMNLSAGNLGEGLTDDEIRTICAAYQVRQTIF